MSFEEIKILHFPNTCRCCISQNEKLVDIFETYDKIEIAKIIQKICDIKISVSDNLPKNICETCLGILRIIYDFRKICRESNETLSSLLESDNEIQEEFASDNTTIIVSICDDGNISDINICEENNFDENISGRNICDENNSADNTSDGNICDENNFNDNFSNGISCEKYNSDDKISDKNNSDDDSHSNDSHRTNSHSNISNSVNSNNKNFDGSNSDSNYSSKIKMLDDSAETKHNPSDRKCPYCNKEIFRKANLNVHIKRHLISGKHVCSHCNKKYHTKYDLRRHMTASHSEGTFYNCDKCTKKFPTNSELKRHSKIHNSVQSYQCSFCSKLFQRRLNAQQHIRAVHERKKKYYNCENCHKSFPFPSKLKRHQNSKCTLSFRAILKKEIKDNVST